MDGAIRIGRRSFAAGALAAALALAFLWAVSRVSTSVPFVPLALAERIIRLTPGGLATFAIEQLQHAAVPALSTAVVAAYAVAGGALAAARRRRRGTTALAMGVIFAGALAAGTLSYRQPGTSLAASLAADAAAAALYVVALDWLASTLVRPALPPDPARREALGTILSAVAGLALGGTLLGRLWARAPRPVALQRPDRAALTPTRAPFPSIRGLSPELTEPGSHYVVDIDVVDPRIDAGGWRLRVDGEVSDPLWLDADALQTRFRTVEQVSVLTCVSNPVGGPLIGNSTWTGVRLADILATARPGPRASHVVFECADDYTVAVPLAIAMAPYALVALGHGGEPLRQEHGAPCRVRIPALYGMMNAKWLERIRVADAAEQGYWAQRGWSASGVVRTESRIDTRADVAAAEGSWLAGVAWAGDRGISRVEVSTDGGRTWAPARLRRPLSPYAWTQWAYRWRPPRPGAYRVMCRAADGTGRLQDAARRPPHPSGATGYHSVTVRAV